MYVAVVVSGWDIQVKNMTKFSNNIGHINAFSCYSYMNFIKRFQFGGPLKTLIFFDLLHKKELWGPKILFSNIENFFGQKSSIYVWVIPQNSGTDRKTFMFYGPPYSHICI